MNYSRGCVSLFEITLLYWMFVEVSWSDGGDKIGFGL